MTSTAVSNFHTTTQSLANQFHLQNIVRKAVTVFYLLQRKYPRIDTIRGYFLLERLAKFHRNLALVT